MSTIIASPLSRETICSLRAGDFVLLSGTIYAARDAAHALIVKALETGETPPFELSGQTVYYAGPCPAAPGEAIGPCGPTTSSRMDVYTPATLDAGIKCMVGKGQRSRQVVDSIVKNGAVYLAAVGGAGALYAACVKKSEIIAYAHLGAEAVLRLTVCEMPLFVAIDSRGQSIYHKD